MSGHIQGTGRMLVSTVVKRLSYQIIPPPIIIMRADVLLVLSGRKSGSGMKDCTRIHRLGHFGLDLVP